jgi:hypothetical protein
MSILNFKAALLGGGARANQFRVTLGFPSFVANSSIAASNAQFLCTAASLPGQTINVAPVMYRGREVKLAGERRFDNWQITVLNDTTFDIHNAFEAWMQKINNKQENSGITNPLQYTVNLNVEQLDRNGLTLKKYTFQDAWPVSISPIQLNFGSNDQVEEFQVELAYGWFETEAGAGGQVVVSTALGTL